MKNKDLNPNKILKTQILTHVYKNSTDHYYRTLLYC